MPNLKCTICGTEFPALKERHYISCDPITVHFATAVDSVNGPILFDTFDCPNCGCQNIAQQRKHRFDQKPEDTMKKMLLSCRVTSLYFDDFKLAKKTLDIIKKYAETNDFISLAEVDQLLGKSHNILSKWGWSDLRKTTIVRTSRGCYISFPAITTSSRVKAKEGISNEHHS